MNSQQALYRRQHARIVINHEDEVWLRHLQPPRRIAALTATMPPA
jgi:hypothetical protein